LLPYIEQGPLYAEVQQEIAASGFNRQVNVGGSFNPVTTTNTLNGVTYTNTTLVWSGGTVQDHGIYIPDASTHIFSLLRCPSDLSLPSDQLASGWGATNYLANWNSWSGSNGNGLSNFGAAPGMPPWDLQVPAQSYGWGYYSTPQKLTSITDGLSSTILFAEGYAACDAYSRVALYSANYHNFGLTSTLNNATVTAGTMLPSGNYNYPNGLPNTFMFQVQPSTQPSPCPAGIECCEGWRAQTPHALINVALADASVRSFSQDMNPTNWTWLMLPKDGQQATVDQ
jgi:hypothetical protein